MTVAIFRRGIAAVAVLSGLLLVPATPAQAVSAGPRVIAVHRSGAVDIVGGSKLGTIAKMAVPAGNWLITATATIQGTDSALATYCLLVAGSDSSTNRTDPTGNGPGSLAAMDLLLAHHFAKAGSVLLQCDSTSWTGDILIRDVHVTAVEVGQLTDPAGTFGTGTPRGLFGQDGSTRLYFDLNPHDVEDLALPAGTWLVQAEGWGFGDTDGDRVDCSLSSGSSTLDSSIQAFEDIAGRSIGLDGVVTLSQPGTVAMDCTDTDAFWSIRGSALSALKVGTLEYGHLGDTLTTSGSGSPTVIGAFSDDAGAVAASPMPQSIASLPLGSGSWFVLSHLSLLTDAAYANTTCQLRLSGASDQGRVIMDDSDAYIGWLGSSLTEKLPAKSKASIACGQSASANEVLFLHDKIFAIMAGTLTDTILN